MVNRPFEEICEEDLQGLVAASKPEDRELDYKSELPGSSDGDKKEFLADISSFANASGGDILYGIDEQRVDGRASGLPRGIIGLTGANIDSETRRLESMIRDGIAPRIAGVRMRAVTTALGPVLVIRIPRSWSAPHMVTFQGQSKFFARAGGGKYQLDVNELRSAFTRSAELTERLRHFHAERVRAIQQHETPVQIAGAPCVVLHVIPIPGFAGSSQIDAVAFSPVESRLLPLRRLNGGAPGRYNIDGYVSFRESGRGYLQVFRNGVFEAVDTTMVATRPLSDEGLGRDLTARSIPSLALANELTAGVQAYLRLIRDLQLGLPAAVLVTLTDVKGVRLGVSTRLTFDLGMDGDDIDRPVLHLPDIVIEDSGADIRQALKPILDALWQAAGWPRCMDYNEAGQWAPPR